MIDVIGGLLVVVAGLLVFAFAVLNHELGTARRMGPGFFPAALGLAAAIVGGVIVASAFGRSGSPDKIAWRPALWVFASVVGFMVGMYLFGLFAAIILTIFLAARADAESSLRETLILTVVVCVGCWLIFSVGLGMPLPMIRTPF